MNRPPARDPRLPALHTEASPLTPAEPDWPALRRRAGDTTYRWRAWAVPDDRPLSFEAVAGPVHYRACGIVGEFGRTMAYTYPEDYRHHAPGVLRVRCNYVTAADHAGRLATAVTCGNDWFRAPDDPPDFTNPAAVRALYPYTTAAVVTWGYRVVTPAAVEWRCATRLAVEANTTTTMVVTYGRDPNPIAGPLPDVPGVADFVHRHCPINHGSHYEAAARGVPAIPTRVAAVLVGADYPDVETVVNTTDPTAALEAAERVKALTAATHDLHAWLDEQVGRALAAYARTVC